MSTDHDPQEPASAHLTASATVTMFTTQEEVRNWLVDQDRKGLLQQGHFEAAIDSLDRGEDANEVMGRVLRLLAEHRPKGPKERRRQGDGP
jgi:hypothetical protein